MFGLGGWEVGVLVIAGLLFFGPNKLPQLMRQAGKIMREIKKASAEFQYSIEREFENDEYRKAHRRDKRRRKKLIEAGLDPDAPENKVKPKTAATPAAPETPAPTEPAAPTAAPIPAPNVPVEGMNAASNGSSGNGSTAATETAPEKAKA